jgi:proteasome lid subunit RPN8/RPN11
MKIIIPRLIISKLIEHSLLEDPNECCGYLLGNQEEVKEIFLSKNIHKTPITRYTMDPLDMLEADNICEEKNLEILAIYHSHTHSQAYPSITDIKNAINSGWTDPKYILVSLVEKTRPIIRAYNISSDKVVNEIIIEHDGEAYISPS